MAIDLQHRFDAALKRFPDGIKALQHAFDDEDDYKAVTLELLRGENAPKHVIDDYGRIGALAGGAEAAQVVLERIAAALRADRSDLPPILVRWWPERTPDARCTVGESGALIRVNIGILTHVRLLVHLLASCLGEVTGDVARFGEDRYKPDQARQEYLAAMDEFVGGTPLPLRRTVLVHWGSRERFRRVATWGGLAYVVAHEMGHAEASNTREAAAATVRDANARAMMLVHNAEAFADLAAFDMLRASGRLDDNDELAFAYAAGAACALAAQACLFWYRAAETDLALSWTHPVPDLRIGLACLALGDPREADRLRMSGDGAHFVEIEHEQGRKLAALRHWIDAVTGMTKFRAKALDRGLSGRGLSPVQLVPIYVAYGIPVQEEAEMAVDYQAGTPDNWAEGAEKFRYDEEGEFLSGECPRCNHPFEESLADEIGLALSARNVEADAKILRYSWECSCIEPHKGAPAGTLGCGASGVVKIEFVV